MLTAVVEPIPVLDLFADLHDRLLELLRSLSPDEWQRPTVCSRWKVKDIAAHLLDGDLRRLSAQRDGYRTPDAPDGFASHQELVAYLDALNSTWTRAAARLSPRVLIELLALAHPQVIELYRSLDPFGPAIYPVGWAGESGSTNWFDIAREYTERWHHQAQIRLAVDQPGDLLARRFYRPLLETFLRALPYTFREVQRPEGTVVTVAIVDEQAGRVTDEWSVVLRDGSWELCAGTTPEPAGLAVIPDTVAWRVFTKRSTCEAALSQYPAIRLSGDLELAGRVLEMISIMA